MRNSWSQVGMNVPFPLHRQVFTIGVFLANFSACAGPCLFVTFETCSLDEYTFELVRISAYTDEQIFKGWIGMAII